MLVLCLSFLVAVADQTTKYLVTSRLQLGESLPVVPGLVNLTYVRNTGAAWGMFGGWNDWLAVLSVIILAAIVFFRRSILQNVWAHRIALGLMIGGIVGNLLDRIRLLHVVDFIDCHWGVRHFPAFNIVDAAISVGVGIYVISSFWISNHPLNGAVGDRAKSASQTGTPAPVGIADEP